MKKKIVGWGVALLALAGGAGAVVNHLQEQTRVQAQGQATNEKKTAEEALYQTALKAVEKAEKSKAEKDIEAAQAMVDKVTKSKFYLQDRLVAIQKNIQTDTALQGLEDLLVKAEANPMDDAATDAAWSKYEELEDTSKYALRIHSLPYKKGAVLVSQAESSLSQGDYRAAIEFVKGYLKQYMDDNGEAIKFLGIKGQLSKEHENLVARLEAVSVRQQQIAADQKAREEAQAAAKAEQGGETVAPASNGGQTYVGGDTNGYVGDQGGYVSNQGGQVPQQASQQAPQTSFGDSYTSNVDGWTAQDFEDALNDPNNYHHLPDGTKVLKGGLGLDGITSFKSYSGVEPGQ